MNHDLTSHSLVLNLRDKANSEAWERFNDLYSPFIEGWLIKQGIPRDVAEDVRQEVMAKVCEQIAGFDHNGRVGAFRTWLRQIIHFRLRTIQRQRWQADKKRQEDHSDLIEQLGAEDSVMCRQWDAEHDAYLARRMLEMVQAEFAPQTIEIFKRVILNAEDAHSVATDLQITVNAVRIAQSRVLAAMRRVGEEWAS